MLNKVHNQKCEMFGMIWMGDVIGALCAPLTVDQARAANCRSPYKSQF